jgi:hypothetical protein
MEFIDTYREWFDGLSDDEQAEARAVDGAVPGWMVVSLEDAGIELVPAVLADGRPMANAYLMPTVLTTLLAAESE